MQKQPVVIALSAFVGIFILFLIMILLVGNLAEPSKSLLAGSRIAVVDVKGPILESRELIFELERLSDDSSVKAIVLRIDSPGGGVGPSQEIHDEILRIKAIKPIVASMGSVAASGGYYIAAPCNQIIANPGTLTGSIGVIMEFADMQELLKKVGVQPQVIKSGQHKDIGSPSRSMTEADRKLLQTVIDDTHQQFVTAVAQGRSLTEEQVRPLADGRIFSGRQAKKVGLVDALGGLKQALSVAAELGGIEGDPEIIYPEEKLPSFVDLLLENIWNKVENQLSAQRAEGLYFMWTDTM